MTVACSSLGSILDDTDSELLHRLLVPGKGLPDMSSILKHFKDAFDWVDANSTGRIIPREGADAEYDSASRKIEEIQSELEEHIKEQKKLLSNKTVTCVTVGKDAYLLEVPESLSGSVPKDYELRSSKKGFSRYWTPYIKKLVGELTQVKAEKESKLKCMLQTLIGRFCEHRSMWKSLDSAVAELDVLISLVIASDYYEGPTCCPNISVGFNANEVPHLAAKSPGHPTIKSDSLGRGTFVPNDINIGGSDHATFVLLTGPNMGGKSTLLCQICLAVILTQVGAYVPAESFELSLVDPIFVRMGAKDHIMAGQSTFLTELSETTSMLFAHRDCIQRWCDEKGDIICEICLQKYEPNYTAIPKQPKKSVVRHEVVRIRGSLEVPRTEEEQEPQNTDLSGIAECTAEAERSASCCRTIALIFTFLLLVRHLLEALLGGAKHQTSHLQLY